MASSVSEITLNASDDLTAKEDFVGKNRSLRPFDEWACVFENGSEDMEEDEEEDDKDEEDEVCLNHVVWSKLREELLIPIFARLPVKNILQIRSLSKSWRSTITSLEFQKAFSEASLVRIALLNGDENFGKIILSQENKEECFRRNLDTSGTELIENLSGVAGSKVFDDFPFLAEIRLDSVP